MYSNIQASLGACARGEEESVNVRSCFDRVEHDWAYNDEEPNVQIMQANKGRPKEFFIVFEKRFDRGWNARLDAPFGFA